MVGDAMGPAAAGESEASAKAARAPAPLGRLFLAHSASWFVLFQAIRLITNPRLGLAELRGMRAVVQVLFVGVIADVPIAVLTAALLTALGAFAGVLSSLLLGRRGRQRGFVAAPAASLGLSILLGGLAASHIIYVEFWGTPLNPAHISYLFDPTFLSAGLPSLLDWRMGLVLAVHVLLSLVLVRWARAASQAQSTELAGVARPLWRAWLAPLAAMAVAVGLQVTLKQLHRGHNAWRTPTSLRENFVGLLIERLSKREKNAPLTAEEIAALAGHLAPDPQATPEQMVKRALEGDARGAETPIGLALKQTVRDEIAARSPVYVFIVMLESWRPADSRAVYPELPRTYSPFFDKLADKSVLFTNTYTASSATRNGQEAALCGVLTADRTSIMRTLVFVDPACMPRLLKAKYGERAFVAWWHGGGFGFDGQGLFWQRHEVDRVVAQEDFDAGLPTTDYGVSDFALGAKVASELPKTGLGHDIQLHFILTLSNHHPWKLPPDAPPELRGEIDGAPHPGSVTMHYSDMALEQLVSFLRAAPCPGCGQSTYWDHSIVVLTNDHGNTLPSLLSQRGIHGSSKPELQSAVMVMSTKGLVLITGGLTERALTVQGLAGARIDRLASQVDIFPTVLDLLGVESIPTVGDSLFANARRWPVWSESGSTLLAPDERARDRGAVADSARLLANPTALPGGARPEGALDPRTQVVFRAYTQLIRAGLAGTPLDQPARAAPPTPR